MDITSWGKTIDGVPYSRDWICLSCDFYGGLGVITGEYIILGIDTSHIKPSNEFSKSTKIACVFQCPKCNELYWFHLSEDTVRKITKNNEAKIPKT